MRETEWIIKSRSDTDQVWAEVYRGSDEETGRYQYQGMPAVAAGLAGIIDLRPPKNQRRNWKLIGIRAALAIGAVGGTVSLVKLFS